MNRAWLPKRIAIIFATSELLYCDRGVESEPDFALCYGYAFGEKYSRVVGQKFDADGFAWCGPTLCALTPKPTSRPLSPTSNSN